MSRQTRTIKYIIIGAGPGGLQAGYFLQKNQRDYLILERARTAGSFFATQPRHRKLISINKKNNFFEEEEFNWRHDWNSLLSDEPSMRFTCYSDELFPSADTMYQYLQDYAAHFQLNIAYGTNVSRISRDADGEFTLSIDDGSEYRCRVLLMALGAVAPHVAKEIEGIELTTSYDDHELDLERYRNKRVGIIGQGNSAFETADHLSGAAAFVHILAKRPVRMAWDTHFVGDVRAVNNSIFDMYQLKSLHAVLNPKLKSITRLADGTLETSHEYDYPDATPPGTLELTREYDEIITCTGYRWVADELFDDAIKPRTWYKGKYPDLTSTWESSNVKDLFFVGAAMQGNDKKSSSGFIHGFRYNIQTLARLLEERYEGVPYPSTTFSPISWDELLSWMYDRFSISASLFQLYGVLCDTVIISEDLSRATVLKERPLEYASALDYGDNHALLLSLEFGFHQFNEPSLTFMGPSDPTDTKCAAFLHPVIRHIHKGRQRSEFHFGDSLLARWDRPHGKGGAVMSYHYTFQRWLEDRLSIDLNLPEPIEGAYRKWSREEVERWQRAHKQQTTPPPPCTRPGGGHGGEGS